MKFFTAILVLILAIVLQSWLGFFGLFANLVFATLVAFAFIFDFWQFAILILLGVFLMNWEPTINFDIVVLALIPLLAWVARRLFHLDAWIGCAVAVPAGTILLYLLLGPQMAVSSFGLFFLDMILCSIFSQMIFWGMGAWA